MDNTEFKTELLKLAGDLRDIARELKESSVKQLEPEQSEKTASSASPDFSMGAVGGDRRSNDPLMDFIFS
jgi:hypothetical protein